MIQVFGQNSAQPVSRRAAALLLAVLLNLALIPCSMAIEVVEEGHDCCPPEVNLEALDCCELDDVSVDSRGGSLEHDLTPDLDVVPAGAPTDGTAVPIVRYLANSDPPDPPGRRIALHKQHCVYLK